MSIGIYDIRQQILFYLVLQKAAASAMVLYFFIQYTSRSIVPHFISLVFKCRVDRVADFYKKASLL